METQKNFSLAQPVWNAAGHCVMTFCNHFQQYVFTYCKSAYLKTMAYLNAKQRNSMPDMIKTYAECVGRECAEAHLMESTSRRHCAGVCSAGQAPGVGGVSAKFHLLGMLCHWLPVDFRPTRPSTTTSQKHWTHTSTSTHMLVQIGAEWKKWKWKGNQ